MFQRRSDRTGRRTTRLLMAASVAAAPLAVLAQGVPDIDAKGILAAVLQIDTARDTRAAEIEENARWAEILSREEEQLAALDGTLELLTGTSAFIPGLEDGGGAGSDYAASTVYAIDDNNPYVDRIMGDAPVTIEQMIAETAIKFGGHPALGRAGINAVEFRCWFQALVKQEDPIFPSARKARRQPSG